MFDTKNEYYLSTAKNIRKRWFMSIIRSLTYNAYYIRGQARYKTCFNNGYIESMNNVVKLVKRNAHGFRYFDNLRKRIFLHLGCKYEFKFKKRKKEQLSLCFSYSLILHS
ncbi:transposase [Coprobacillaceae bacterium CR2/5/TPMF4]|nr:transposase [Coprobacillaceae bacterium CR2/5/TPMF4]